VAEPGPPTMKYGISIEKYSSVHSRFIHLTHECPKQYLGGGSGAAVFNAVYTTLVYFFDPMTSPSYSTSRPAKGDLGTVCERST